MSKMKKQNPAGGPGDKPRRRTIRIRSIISLVGLATSFVVSAVAQQPNTPDPQTIERLNSLVKKGDEAYNRNDAAAVAALYTEDAVLLTDTGPIRGRKAIEKWYADLFKLFHISNRLSKADEFHLLSAADKEVWSTGEWSETLQSKSGGPMQVKGYWAAIKVYEGGVWKERLETWNVTPAPATPAQTK
jgi:ketosteroid isomerase-like protein